ncbi:hypothetical protein BofuT4_uP081910.1 [Botrytis cinerea T4]|uniref:Uncharacterized protein n=1 Tax=Botryotinia fuckeliana (strain T4) TaxID=999810 RepID=G2YK84_BOTF4|nr:hypothetical protein BofuT4_uP081910.1 [Botrytis cinerea T4]
MSSALLSLPHSDPGSFPGAVRLNKTQTRGGSEKQATRFLSNRTQTFTIHTFHPETANKVPSRLNTFFIYYAFTSQPYIS